MIYLIDEFETKSVKDKVYSIDYNMIGIQASNPAYVFTVNFSSDGTTWGDEFAVTYQFNVIFNIPVKKLRIKTPILLANNLRIHGSNYIKNLPK